MAAKMGAAALIKCSSPHVKLFFISDAEFTSHKSKMNAKMKLGVNMGCKSAARAPRRS